MKYLEKPKNKMSHLFVVHNKTRTINSMSDRIAEILKQMGCTEYLIRKYKFGCELNLYIKDAVIASVFKLIYMDEFEDKHELFFDVRDIDIHVRTEDFSFLVC